MSAQVTAMGIRDGDPAVLTALVNRRGAAVLAFCEATCAPSLALDAAADAFTRFRAAVLAADHPAALDPEAALLSATRHAAAARTPRPAAQAATGLARVFGTEAPDARIGDLPALIAARADGTITPDDDAALSVLLATAPVARAIEARFAAAEEAYRQAPREPLPAPLGDQIVMTMAALAAAPPPDPAALTVDDGQPTEELAPPAAGNGAVPPAIPVDPAPVPRFFRDDPDLHVPPEALPPTPEPAAEPAPRHDPFSLPVPEDFEPPPPPEVVEPLFLPPLDVPRTSPDDLIEDTPPDAPEVDDDAAAEVDAEAVEEPDEAPEADDDAGPEADAEVAEEPEVAADDEPETDVDAEREADADVAEEPEVAADAAPETDAEVAEEPEVAADAAPDADADAAPEADAEVAEAADDDPEAEPAPDGETIEWSAPDDTADAEPVSVDDAVPDSAEIAAARGDGEVDPSSTVEWSVAEDELGEGPELEHEIAAARLRDPGVEEDPAHLQSASGALAEEDVPSAPPPTQHEPDPPAPPAPKPAATDGRPHRHHHGPLARTALVPAAAVVAIAAVGALAASGIFGGNDPSPPVDTGIVPERALQAVPEGEASAVVDDLRSAAADARRRRLADLRRQLAAQQALEATTPDVAGGTSTTPDTGDAAATTPGTGTTGGDTSEDGGTNTTGGTSTTGTTGGTP